MSRAAHIIKEVPTCFTINPPVPCAMNAMGTSYEDRFNRSLSRHLIKSCAVVLIELPEG
jgi:hypothetical protein